MGAGVVWDTAAYDMDVHAFTDQYMDAIVDGQSAEGAFPALAPSPLYNNFAWNLPGTIPSWGDAGIILPWTSWQRYGDLSIVKRHFDVMQRHIQYVLTRNPSYLWKAGRNMDLGDWLALYVIKRPNDLPETSRELLATAYWAHSADLLSQMAGAIGRVEDAQRLRDIFRNVRDAFNNAYVKPNGTVGDESQTSYVLALAFNLLPEGVRQLAAARLATDVRRRGTTLTTGVQGSALILDALADSGYADLAYELLLQTKFPSWGYMINAGATTLWETWSGKLEDGVNVTPMALNHGDLGSMGGFLFRRVVGIEPATPGFERVNIRPTITPRLKEVSGSFESIMGRIAVAWRWRSGASYSLDVTVPPNVQASVRILADQSQYIREGRRDLQRSEDVHIVGRTGHEVMLDIGSGEYSFLVAPQAASRTQSAPQHSVP